MCPSCGQNAPLVYRGVSAYCSACGQPRTPFTANAVNLRGKPSRIGGAVASVAGWVILAGTLFAALLVGAILQAIFPAGAIVGWVLGGIIAAVGVGVSLLLLLGGRALKRSGVDAAQAARLEALGGLAAHQRGYVTAESASEALGCPIAEADALLTALAKQPESGVTLEVDDDGKISYRFARHVPAGWPEAGKLRVDDVPAPPKTLAPADGEAAPRPRVATVAMPAAEQARLTGPAGTKLVPVHPSQPPAGREVEVSAEDEGSGEQARRG
jgi:hypothetical protein